MIELQSLDCNCNDCFFMQRDLVKFKQSQELHRKWQQDYFNTIKQNLLNRAQIWINRGFPDKAIIITKEASRMKFQFDKKEASINYGHCRKKNIDVTFLPNTLQLDTQDCFEHRRIKQ